MLDRRFSWPNVARLLLTSAVFGMFVAQGVGSVAAFPEERWGGSWCGSPSYSNWTIIGPGWTVPKRDAVDDRFQQWEDVEDADGQAPVSIGGYVTPQNQGPNTLKFGVFSSATAIAVTRCVNSPTPLIEFGSGFLASASAFEIAGTALHELGHGFGLRHSGKNDSWDGQRPTMNTCVSNSQIAAFEVRQDDEQNVLNGHSTHQSQNRRSMTANFGFEASDFDRLWGFKTTSRSVAIDDPDSGSNSLQFTGSQYGFLYQTSNFTYANDRKGTMRVDARVQAKRVSSAVPTAGGFRLQVYAAGVQYDATDSFCEDQFQSDLQNNLNIRQWDQVWQMRKNKNIALTTSWAQRQTQSWTIPADNGAPPVDFKRYDGADIRIRIRSSLKSGGSYSTIRIDDARLRTID